jgi:hypothetical protein
MQNTTFSTRLAKVISLDLAGRLLIGALLVVGLTLVGWHLRTYARDLYRPDAVTYYVCDCTAGADANCIPGDDGNGGTDPGEPWRTYETARSQFGGLAAGDAIRFCRGGAFTLDQAGSAWVNGNCTAANPCTVGDYAPPWGSGDENRPILRRVTDSYGFSLADSGYATREEGYVFENLDLRCAACDTGNGFFLFNDVDDVLIDNVRMDGFGIGVHLAGSNECDSSDPTCNGISERLTVRRATIVNSGGQGFLGGGDGLVIEDSYFESNGGGTMFDHNIYISSGNDVRISGNELYRSSLDGEGQCRGVSLVGHGVITDLIIENNFVHEDVGLAGQGCWGVAIDPAYGGAERFEDVVIRGNRVVNVGNVAIGVGACVDCLIENNVVIHYQDFGVNAIAVPDRDPGSGDAETTNVTVRNNSILVSSGGRGIRVYEEGTSHQIVSNAIQYTGDSSSWQCLQTDLPASRYEAIDYNVCGFEHGDWAVGADDLAAWQALGWGVHSQATVPGFTGDYDLTPVAENAAIVDAAHPTLSSPTDRNGTVRDAQPDVGAYEFVPRLSLVGVPSDEMIHLNWRVNAALPSTTTWHVDYYTQTASVYTATNPISATRSIVLVEHVHNYQWYTVTLSTVGTMPILSDTVCVMPTDRFVYLPLIVGSN